jgi:type I restriction enzyme S subunit
MNRYDSYKDSGVEWIGEIPSGWETIRLGMLGVFSSSGIDKKIIEGERTVRMVNYTDLIQSRRYYPIQTGEKDYMRVTTPESKMKEHRLERGDMVFIPSSETHEDLGYSSLIDFEEDDIVYSYHILRYKTKKPVFHYFKKYLVNHHSVLNQFSKECKGTTRQIIGRDVFNNVRVVLPSLSEQQQIVSFLDSKTSQIDELIQKKERKIELLKEYRTSLINQVVTKGLNPNVEKKDSGVEWIGEIPSHWKRNKLIRITDRIGDGLHSTPKYVNSSEYFFINGNNLVNGEIKIFDSTKCVSEEEFKEHFIQLNSKTLLLSINGTIGNLSFYNGEKVILGKSSCYINLKEHINHHFVYYFLKSESISKYFTFELTGTTIFNLSLNSVRNTPIVIPPEIEQQQIVEYLDDQTSKIDNSIQLEEKKIELLKEYRQSLISSVVTGKIDVRTN